jgi:predicted transcriptional regulator
MQKQRVQRVLDAFPEDVNVDEFLEKVYLLQKIETGERQIEAGETVSHEDAKQRLQKWLA